MARAPRQDEREITQDAKEALDEQIRSLQKITDHQIREFPVSVIVDKFQEGLETDQAELYIPDYQREFVWSNIQKSRFIESLLLNIPIPYVFVADIGNDDGRLEIVDGSQRIRTLYHFLNDKFTLTGLKKLTSANGFKYSDFTPARKLRFDRKTIRMIELTELCDEEARREIFDRLNTGGIKLTTMEQRQGSNDGPFLDVVNRLSENAIFREICPLNDARISRGEYPELVLRYFAYCDEYLNFEKSVDTFLTEYLDRRNASFVPEQENELSAQFNAMCEFVRDNFPNGFRKNSTANTVPRIRFEAIAVGSTLALKRDPQLTPPPVDEWLNSQDFIKHTRSDASNSKPKVKARIEYVRDRLLGVPPQESAQDDAEE
ncbi:DUF262 domain-containing protein [Cronobacter dublinensis]|uniref:DUF262 domain-containing protein n=1 Tax=Cronobacter dublinensis TaxID=413497 RepID=UPI00192A5AAA|nr:DUF262 domain-containing protein [Cronobacter dublinensis]